MMGVLRKLLTKGVSMKLIKLFVIAAVMCASPAYAAPKAKAKAAVDKAPVAAVVNGKKVYIKELQELKDAVPQLQQISLDALYEQLQASMIDATLLSQAAEKEKIKNDPQYKKLAAEMEEQLARRLYLDKKIKEMRTKDKMQKIYAQYLKDNPPQEEVKASHILVKTEREAADIIKQLNAGADFAEIANKKSIDPSGNGGDLGFFSRETMVPEFAEAAFSMKEGELSQKPVKTQFGYHVIKVEKRRIAEPPAFEEVETQLSERFNVDASDEVMKNLRSKAKIVRYDINGKPLDK